MDSAVATDSVVAIDYSLLTYQDHSIVNCSLVGYIRITLSDLQMLQSVMEFSNRS